MDIRKYIFDTIAHHPSSTMSRDRVAIVSHIHLKYHRTSEKVGNLLAASTHIHAGCELWEPKFSCNNVALGNCVEPASDTSKSKTQVQHTHLSGLGERLW
jgi:hypothetical protein